MIVASNLWTTQFLIKRKGTRINMAKVNVNWLQDMTFIGTDSTDHSVVLSSPKDGVGMKPSELLLVSLASCTAVDVVSILQKKRVKLTGLSVEASAEQADEGWPRPYNEFNIHYVVTGIGIKEDDIRKAIELSEGKYCSISATLKPAGDVTTSYEIIEAEV
jgi:putative redox protein